MRCNGAEYDTHQETKQYLAKMLDRHGLGLLEQKAHDMSQWYVMAQIPGKPVLVATLNIDRNDNIAVRMHESVFYRNLADMCNASEGRIYLRSTVEQQPF